MNFKNAPQEKTWYSYHQGDIFTDYQTLVKIFGEPSGHHDNIKSDAEWIIEFEDGTIATIYNYKDGKNYLGDRGTPIELIKHWNVGGFSPRAFDLIKEAIKD